MYFCISASVQFLQIRHKHTAIVALCTRPAGDQAIAIAPRTWGFWFCCCFRDVILPCSSRWAYSVGPADILKEYMRVVVKSIGEDIEVIREQGWGLGLFFFKFVNR